MTTAELRSHGGSTSAAGPMITRKFREPVVVGLLLAGLGTSTDPGSISTKDFNPWRRVEHTTAGAASSTDCRSGSAIAELRRVSGLTWDQLARIFKVNRRSLHFWASGKPMTASHEEQLQRLVSLLREIDRGSASTNRAALLSAQSDGRLPVDLLADGAYERVLTLIGRGEARRAVPPKLSQEARSARVPSSPEELIGALHNRIHPASGPLIRSRVIVGARKS